METIAPVSTRTRPLMWMSGGLAVFGTILTAAILAIGVSTQRDVRAVSYAGGFLVIGCLGLGYLLLWHRNARLLVGQGTFGYQDILGRRRTWSSPEVGAVVEATVAFNRRTPPRPAVYVIGLDGRRLLGLNRVAWEPAAIDRLVRATGKSLEVRPGMVSVQDFARDYPRVFGWAVMHSYLAGGLLALGLGGVLVAVLLLLEATLGAH